MVSFHLSAKSHVFLHSTSRSYLQPMDPSGTMAEPAPHVELNPDAPMHRWNSKKLLHTVHWIGDAMKCHEVPWCVRPCPRIVRRCFRFYHREKSTRCKKKFVDIQSENENFMMHQPQERISHDFSDVTIPQFSLYSAATSGACHTVVCPETPKGPVNLRNSPLELKSEIQPKSFGARQQKTCICT